VLNILNTHAHNKFPQFPDFLVVPGSTTEVKKFTTHWAFGACYKTKWKNLARIIESL